MAIVFGLDFGTTNSALSVNINGNVKVIDVDMLAESKKSLRSVLFFHKNGQIYIGQEAIMRYLENAENGRFLQSIKTFLPSTTFESTSIGNKMYFLEEIISLILKRLKKMGEQVVDAEVDEVVLGRPVSFSDDSGQNVYAQWRLQRAAEIAGFKKVHFQYEPIAAAYAYEDTLKTDEERMVLIGDFGGGTSDFSIIRLRGGSRRFGLNRKDDILSLGGVPIAGDVFDAQIMWQKVAKHFGKGARYRGLAGELKEVPTNIIYTLRKWHQIPLLNTNKNLEYIGALKHAAMNKDKKVIENLENLIKDNYGFILHRQIEKAKIELSGQPETHISFNEGSLSIFEKLSQGQFERIIKREVGKISKILGKTLKKADLPVGKIDAVYLTGGTSYIPCIRNIFIRKFGEEKIKYHDAFTSVAHGLGLSASMVQ